MTLFELQAWLGHRTPPPPSTTRRSPRTPCPRPTPKPATSPATCAPSRCSSTATRSPPAPPPPASLGSTTTSGTAGAATASSSSARTGWPAPAATSTPRKTPPRPSCSRPKDNLQRMLAEIPLTDDERAAVDDGQAAVDRSTRPPRRRPHSRRTHTAPDRRPGDRNAAADPADPPRHTMTDLTDLIPQNRIRRRRVRSPHPGLARRVEYAHPTGPRRDRPSGLGAPPRRGHQPRRPGPPYRHRRPGSTRRSRSLNALQPLGFLRRSGPSRTRSTTLPRRP